MKIYRILTLMVLVVSTLVHSKNPIIKTNFGRIEGISKKSRDGRPFHAYVGIPYALPPIGKLRFEPPQPLVEPWEEIFVAQYPSPPCLQHTQEKALEPTEVKGSEDCLYLNIFVPHEQVRKNKGLLPVILYIYGGAYREGEGIHWGTEFFMDNDIIYVTFNHRLGILGFLSTEDRVVPGNMGLKDQALVIEWVSENIGSFGGDPKKVTLAGMSSGASSVHFQYLSPNNRGLFHQIIMSSATALNCFAQTEGSLEKTKKLGMLMECPTNDNQEMIECLKSHPAENIAGKLQEFMVYRSNPLVPFGPVVEKDSIDPFIDKSPIEIIESGGVVDLPWLLSSDSDEGIFPGADFIFNEERSKYMDDNWETVAPHLLDFNYTIPISEHGIVSRKIRNFYMDDKRIELNNADDFNRMLGDRIFAVETRKFAKKLAKLNSSPTWYYVNGYRSEYSNSELFGGTKTNIGVAHSDETYLLFFMPDYVLQNETDIQMSRYIVNLWASFAMTGIPDGGVDWPPLDPRSDDLYYLRMSGPGQSRMESDDHFAEEQFWSSIDFNENKMPYE